MLLHLAFDRLDNSQISHLVFDVCSPVFCIFSSSSSSSTQVSSLLLFLWRRREESADHSRLLLLELGGFLLGALLVQEQDLVFVGEALVEGYAGFVDLYFVLGLLVGQPFVALAAVVHEHVADGE